MKISYLVERAGIHGPTWEYVDEPKPTDNIICKCSFWEAEEDGEPSKNEIE